MVKLHLLKGHSRIWVRAYINNVQKVDVMIDTGCHTTMMDEVVAGKYGQVLPDKTVMNIGGKTMDVQGYILKSLSFETLEINNVFVWAMKCEPMDELFGKLLLGLNIMNNWKYSVSRNENIMAIEEDIFMDAPESEYPYMHKFIDGKYVRLQNNGGDNFA